MAIEYFYDPQKLLISIVCRGVISIDDRIYFVRRLFDDPNLPEQASILINVNEVTNAPTKEEIGMIGLLIEKLLSRFCGRVALVNSMIDHVLCSHFVLFNVVKGHSKTRVFASRSEARDWIES